MSITEITPIDDEGDNCIDLSSDEETKDENYVDGPYGTKIQVDSDCPGMHPEEENTDIVRVTSWDQFEEIIEEINGPERTKPNRSQLKQSLRERAAEADKYGIRHFDFDNREEPGCSTETTPSDGQDDAMEVDTPATTKIKGAREVDKDLKMRVLKALERACDNISSKEDLKKEICRIISTEFPNEDREKLANIFKELKCRASAAREEKQFLEEKERHKKIAEARREKNELIRKLFMKNGIEK